MPACLQPADPPRLACRRACRRGMLGWLHRYRGVPADELSLRALLPSSGREGVSLVFDYLLWLQQERGVSVRTEGVAVSGRGGRGGLGAAAGAAGPLC